MPMRLRTRLLVLVRVRMPVLLRMRMLVLTLVRVLMLVYYQGSDIKLGLGDFVFYSVLVGRASMRGAATGLACAVAILTGLVATLALLPILQRVLPALPISIAVGIAFYFSSCGMLDPMADAAAVRHVFL